MTIRSIMFNSVEIPHSLEKQERIEITYQWDSVGHHQLIVSKRTNAEEGRSIILDISSIWQYKIMEEDPCLND